MQCPSRVCTAHAAGGVIRDCLAAARFCRYAVSSRRLAAARLCRYAVSSRRLAADHRCRYAASAVVFCSIATVGDTACRMFADAGVISLFYRGRRLDDVAITISGGDTGTADVQEDTAAAGPRRMFLAAHPSRSEDGCLLYTSDAADE